MNAYRKFVLLSGMAWLASLTVLWLGVNLADWPVWLANAAGDALAVTLVFILYPQTAFGSRHRRWLDAFVPWLLWQAFHIALISWCVDVLSTHIGLLYPHALGRWLEVGVKIAITPVTISLNFLVARWLLRCQPVGVS